jgi:hypothetical protein
MADKQSKTPEPTPKRPFDGLVTLIASAAAAVGAVFGLFNSVLSDLVPPTDENQQLVGIVGVSTTVVLLVLVLLVRRQLRATPAYAIGGAALLALVLAIMVFLDFRELSSTYIYRYPPASLASSKQARHIRGEIHTAGAVLIGSGTVANAVFRYGGPDLVNSMGVLWTEDSRNKVIAKFEVRYVVLTILMASAVFVAGVALWRQRRL